MEITGTVAVVTGGASGLGLATARRIVKAGGRVVLLDLPSSSGEETVHELGNAARFVPADVTDERQVRAALDVAEQLGTLRVAVNCAGIGNAHRTVGREGPSPNSAGSSR